MTTTKNTEREQLILDYCELIVDVWGDIDMWEQDIFPNLGTASTETIRRWYENDKEFYYDAIDRMESEGIL